MVCKMEELKSFSEVRIRFKKAIEIRPNSTVWLRFYDDGRYEVVSGKINHADEHIIEEGHYI